MQNMALANNGYQKKLKDYLLGTQSLEGNYTQILYSKNKKKLHYNYKVKYEFFIL